MLSAFVNSENEIVVSDTIYKITPSGVFYSHLSDVSKLLSYVVNNQKLIENVSSIRETQSGNVKVSEGVYRFIAPISQDEKNMIEKSKKAMASRTPMEDLQPIINGLPISEGTNNWFLHRITGVSKVSEQYFDRRHRVKVEFWNQNYGFYKSVGVSVRNQTRRLRIWWASAAEEILLGINYARLTVQTPTIPLPAINQFDVFFNNSLQPKPILYQFKGSVGLLNGHYNNGNLRIERLVLPFFKIENNDIFNIYIPRVPIIKNIDVSFTTDNIFSQSNIASLYREGFKLLKGLAPEQKEFAVVKEMNNNEAEIIYFAERFHNTNDNSIKKHFEKDFGFLVGMGVSSTGNSSANASFEGVKPAPMRNFKDVKVDFFGMAKVGGNWRGARIVIEK